MNGGYKSEKKNVAQIYKGESTGEPVGGDKLKKGDLHN